MAGHPPHGARLSQRLVLAYTSCLCLGLALLLWSLARVIVERMLTGASPNRPTIALAGLTLLFGLTFVGLYRLIRRDVRWALWAAFVLALVLALAGIAAIVLAATFKPSIFPLFLAGGAAAAAGLALTEQRKTQLTPLD
jgi:4-amino-4-deoxy-L-arabinose transferase-like glycosyltransferase